MPEIIHFSSSALSEEVPFRKLLDSDETKYLLQKYPHAFLLLTYIALHARRTNGYPDGLMIGDVLLGDPKLFGLTRQQYRTALKILVEKRYIKIISNGKYLFERKKSTIGLTINGTLVNLIDSRVYDINPDYTNQRNNQRPTNDQPTTNHKQERTRKNKKEKEQQQKVSQTTIYPDFIHNPVVVFSEKINDNNSETVSQKNFANQGNITDIIGSSLESRTYVNNPAPIGSNSVQVKPAKTMPKIYPCLQHVNPKHGKLTPKDEELLCNKYPEEAIIHAVKWVNTLKEPRSNLMGALRDAAEKKYEIKTSPEEKKKQESDQRDVLIKKNKAKMNKIRKDLSLTNDDLLMSDTCVTIKEKNGSRPIGYSEPSFMIQIESHLRKISKWDPSKLNVLA